MNETTVFATSTLTTMMTTAVTRAHLLVEGGSVFQSAFGLFALQAFSILALSRFISEISLFVICTRTLLTQLHRLRYIFEQGQRTTSNIRVDCR
jgi:hypothetical protein